MSCDCITGPSNRTRIEGWDTTFAMDWQIIPQTSNNQSTGTIHFRLLLCKEAYAIYCNFYGIKKL